jgi:hypothetical protein
MHEAVPELVTLHLWRVELRPLAARGRWRAVPPVSRDLAPVGGGAAGSVDGRDPLA